MHCFCPQKPFSRPKKLSIELIPAAPLTSLWTHPATGRMKSHVQWMFGSLVPPAAVASICQKSQIDCFFIILRSTRGLSTVWAADIRRR